MKSAPESWISKGNCGEFIKPVQEIGAEPVAAFLPRNVLEIHRGYFTAGPEHVQLGIRVSGYEWERTNKTAQNRDLLLTRMQPRSFIIIGGFYNQEGKEVTLL